MSIIHTAQDIGLRLHATRSHKNITLERIALDYGVPKSVLVRKLLCDARNEIDEYGLSGGSREPFGALNERGPPRAITTAKKTQQRPRQPRAVEAPAAPQDSRASNIPGRSIARERGRRQQQVVPALGWSQRNMGYRGGLYWDAPKAVTRR